MVNLTCSCRPSTLCCLHHRRFSRHRRVINFIDHYRLTRRQSVYSKTTATTEDFSHSQLCSPVIKHIPKPVRLLWYACLGKLIRQICTSPNDLSLWTLLINFCSTFFSRLARSDKKHSLSSIIRRRFNDNDNHNIDLSDNSLQVSKHHKSNSLANIVSAKMEDGDVSPCRQTHFIWRKSYCPGQKVRRNPYYCYRIHMA